MIEDVETASPQTWYVHVDHLNRPIRMTDAAKAPVWNAVWTPRRMPRGHPKAQAETGAPHSITGSAVLNARFPGQWFQLEAGLHYNWHRHYDPTIGTYTQPDPLGFVDGPGVYGYAVGSPQRYVDRDGRLVWALPAGPAVVDVAIAVGGVLTGGLIYNVITDWPFPSGKPAENDDTEVPVGYCKATGLTGQIVSGGRLQCVYRCWDGEIIVDTTQSSSSRDCRPTIRKPNRGPNNVSFSPREQIRCPR